MAGGDRTLEKTQEEKTKNVFLPNTCRLRLEVCYFWVLLVELGAKLCGGQMPQTLCARRTYLQSPNSEILVVPGV